MRDMRWGGEKGRAGLTEGSEVGFVGHQTAASWAQLQAPDAPFGGAL